MATEFDIPRSEEYLALLEGRLSDKTYSHVCSVARTMLTMHEAAGISREQAVTAGLLHDACKAYPKNVLTRRAKELGITEHMDNPNLLHGPVAAAECRAELGISDEDILEAIRYHTTGHAGWSNVGNALYIADFAEPNRKLKQAATARKMLDTHGFDATLKYVTEQKVAHVRSKFPVDIETQAFADWVAERRS